MWESRGFKECASDNVLVASDGSGGSRETSKSGRQVASGVATFSLQPLNDTSFKLPRTRQTDGSKSRAMESYPNPQPSRREIEHPIPTDAKYVTRGITHRGDLEQGPNGDLWSILFQLIDERSGVTDVIKVKSHMEDVGPLVFTQNKIVCPLWQTWWLRRRLKDCYLTRLWNAKPKRLNASESGWPNVWRWYKQTSGQNVVQRATLTNSNPWWSLKKRAQGLPLGSWWT